VNIPKQILLSAILISLLVYGCGEQLPPIKKYSLLTWEYRRDGEGVVPIENAQVLVKYTYSDTGYTRKEIFRTDHYIPHYSDYETRVYDDRYLINSTGDIYDLESNKIIHEHIGFDYFIEKSGDSVFMRHVYYEPERTFHKDSVRHRSIKADYYFFDLKTREIVQLKKYGNYQDYNSHTAPLFGIYRSVSGLLSPGRKWVAYFKPKGDVVDDSFMKDSSYHLCGWVRLFPTYGDIFIKSSANDSIKIADSVRFDFGLWVPNGLPILWLSDNELLTHEKNGSVIKITIDPYTITKYTALDSVFNCAFPGRFERTVTNDILYYCRTANGDIFKVNTASNSLEQTAVIPLSSRYSLRPISGHPNFEYVKEYLLDDKKILDDTTSTGRYSITPGDLIAIQCKEWVPSRNQYDHWNTIKIFDPSTGKWIFIKVEYLKRLIGWVKEK
jgi:hypothetical protein